MAVLTESPRRRIRLSFLIGLSLLGLGFQEPAPPAQSEVEQLVDRARALQRDYREREALALYLDALELDPSDFQALCGASYLYGQVGKRLSDKKAQRQSYQKAFDLALQAWAGRPEDPEANLVMAWACGGMALTSGFREQAALARKVKEHVERTLRSRPADHRAWYILAHLNVRVARAGFLQKSLARLLFGGVPNDLSLERAVECYRKAVQIRPDFILYRYELAGALHRLGRLAEAADQLRQALNLDPRFEDDPAVLKQCRQLLSRVE